MPQVEHIVLLTNNPLFLTINPYEKEFDAIKYYPGKQ